MQIPFNSSQYGQEKNTVLGNAGDKKNLHKEYYLLSFKKEKRQFVRINSLLENRLKGELN